MEEQDNAKLHNQDDVNPTTQLDQLVSKNEEEKLPDTNGTGSNRPVQTEGTLVIKKEDSSAE
ncbi:hypothetical protein [Pedobacter sp. L105]|uniref:hypothetical protein n=1 Tax=Pedobacter sp. L105 TaxID=1641871 RepID=UPI00131EAFE7|nr:hypothetical protein [Pedobacter sp. L105]